MHKPATPITVMPKALQHTSAPLDGGRSTPWLREQMRGQDHQVQKPWFDLWPTANQWWDLHHPGGGPSRAAMVRRSAAPAGKLDS